MKKLIFFHFFLSFFFGLVATTNAQNGEFSGRVSLFYEQVRHFKPNRVYQSGGINAEFFVNDEGWFSIGYSTSLGHDTQNGLVFHMPLGVYLSSYPFRLAAINRVNDDFYIWLAVLLLIIPESANFHFKVSNEFVVSPYIAPAGIDYWRTNDQTNVWSPTFSAGIKMHVLKEKMSLAPFAGIKIHYDAPQWNQVQFGVMVGLGWD